MELQKKKELQMLQKFQINKNFIKQRWNTKIVFVVPEKSRISGNVYDIVEYGNKIGSGLPRCLSDIICCKSDTTFVLIGPDNYNISPPSILSTIIENNVYLYENEYEGEYVEGNVDDIHPKDILIFPSNKLTVNNIRSISGLSNFQTVIKFILKKLSNVVYVPKNRIDKNYIPEKRYRISYNDKTIVPIPSVNNIYKCRLASGIGDIILSKALLDMRRDEYSKVIISPYIPPIAKYRPKFEEYVEFVYEMYDLLFKPPYYEISKDQSFIFKPDGMIFKEMGMPKGFKPDLQHLLCKGERIFGEYYTVLTKVRDIDYNQYQSVMKSDIISAIKKLSEKKKVVLVGERELIQPNEYKDARIDRKTFSIYDDIKENIPNVIDMTFPEWGEHTKPSMESIQQTCMYMRDAVCNFSIGRGGLLCMALAVGNVAYLAPGLGEPFFIFEEYWYDNPVKGIHVSINHSDFVQQINNYVEYEKPMEYNTSLNLGLGDIIFARSALDETDYKKITIRPRLSLLSIYNKTMEYGSQTIDMFKRFFSNPPYELIIDYNEEEQGTPQTLYENDRIFPVKPNFSEILCEETEIPESPYIVLHTKVKGLPRFEYLKFRNSFFEILNKLEIKIVLLGEKNIENSKEWKILTEIGSIYSIYDDCKKYLKNYIDMTENDDLIESPKDLYKSCYIIRMAQTAITMGVGGNFGLTSAVAGYHIGLIVHHPYYDKIYECQNVNNGFITKDYNLFLDKIKNIKRSYQSKKSIDWFLKDGKFSFSTSGSIGEMILAVYLLENDPRIESVDMSFWNGFLYAYPNQDVEIRTFFKKFALLLTSNCKKSFNVTDQQYEYTAADSMCTSLGFIPEKRIGFSQLGGLKPIIDEPYIVITSKIRTIQRGEFNSIKDEYFSNLKKLSNRFKLVLIGEKERHVAKGGPAMNMCIYNDIVKSRIPFDDKTVYINRAPNVKSLILDITYIKHAKAVITIGNGGYYCIGLATNANLFSYMGNDRLIYHTGQSELFWKQDWCLKHTYFNDFGKFWSDIHKFLKDK